MALSPILCYIDITHSPIFLLTFTNSFHSSYIERCDTSSAPIFRILCVEFFDFYTIKKELFLIFIFFYLYYYYYYFSFILWFRVRFLLFCFSAFLLFRALSLYMFTFSCFPNSEYMLWCWNVYMLASCYTNSVYISMSFH